MENLCEAELEFMLKRATQVGESVGLERASGIVMDEAKAEFVTRGSTDVAKILRNIAVSLTHEADAKHPGPPHEWTEKQD